MMPGNVVHATAGGVRFAVPELCLPWGLGADWNYFEYGFAPLTQRGVMPANSPLAKYLSSDAGRNAELLIALAEFGGLSGQFAKISNDCKAPQNIGDEEAANMTKNAMDLFRSTPAMVPFQIEHNDSYSFRPENCGRFDSSVEPCWKALDQGPYHPDAILTTGGDERNCCKKQEDGTYDCNTEETDDTEAGNTDDDTEAGNTDSSRRLPQTFYGVHSICPNHHQLCGSRIPPNFPHQLRACNLPTDYRWVQVPIRGSVRSPPQDEDSMSLSGTGSPGTIARVSANRFPSARAPRPTPRAVVRESLDRAALPRGRLPEGFTSGMQWIQAHKDSEICRAYDLEEARRLVEYYEQELGQGRTNKRTNKRTNNGGLSGCPTTRIDGGILPPSVGPSRRFITNGVRGHLFSEYRPLQQNSQDPQRSPIAEEKLYATLNSTPTVEDSQLPHAERFMYITNNVYAQSVIDEIPASDVLSIGWQSFKVLVKASTKAAVKAVFSSSASGPSAAWSSPVGVVVAVTAARGLR